MWLYQLKFLNKKLHHVSIITYEIELAFIPVSKRPKHLRYQFKPMKYWYYMISIISNFRDFSNEPCKRIMVSQGVSKMIEFNEF